MPMAKFDTKVKYDNSLDLTVVYYPPKDAFFFTNNKYGHKETNPIGKTVYIRRMWIDQEYQTWGISCNVLFEVLSSSEKGVRAKIFYVKD
jgi:hypothetical protein